MKSNSRLAFVIMSVLVVLSALDCHDDQPTAPSPALSGIGTWNPEWLGPATFFAPIVYQATYGGSQADYITRFAYDGDWNGGNNWDNLYAYPKHAYLYVSVTETQAHYFIFYGIFHPRDWCTSIFDWTCDIGSFQHENDLEGAMVTVDKRFATPDWPYGQVVTVETVSHFSVYPNYRNCGFTGYTVEPSWTFSSWDGCVT
jgi:hypothetical protein